MPNILELCGEYILIYLLIIICLRLLGKKGIAEMSVPDLVMLIIIGEGINSLVPDEFRFGGVVLFVISISIANYIVNILMFRLNSLRKLIDGNPIVLVSNGNIFHKNLLKERLTVDNLKEALRSKGLENFEEVETAVLETDCKISIIKKNDR